MINTQKIIPKDARILQTVYSRWFTPTIPAWSMMHAIMTWFFMISYDVEEWQVLHLRFSAVSVPENTQKCSRMWLHRDGVWQWGLRRHRKRPKDHLIIIRSVTRKQTVEQIITCRSRHNPAHLNHRSKIISHYCSCAHSRSLTKDCSCWQRRVQRGNINRKEHAGADQTGSKGHDRRERPTAVFCQACIASCWTSRSKIYRALIDDRVNAIVPACKARQQPAVMSKKPENTMLLRRSTIRYLSS